MMMVVVIIMMVMMPVVVAPVVMMMMPRQLHALVGGRRRGLRVCPESFPYGNIALCRFSPTSRSRRDLKETAGFR
jgi:hypothetical protein